MFIYFQLDPQELIRTTLPSSPNILKCLENVACKIQPFLFSSRCIESDPSYCCSCISRALSRLQRQWKWGWLITPSAACMRHWIRSGLAQRMACRLFGTKPLSKPLLVYCQLDLRNKLKWTFNNQNTELSILENASENIVCEMAAVLSRAR